ncbi:UNVERIFIED_CONTAM: Pentatricopeptide repeat-containing protein [Sesamum radiatum]|uniref:Pentatricopeptide repeat-containing protein n=1 Tax=Sesamum radiatum TaxID=300843 RepID=A0AAW2JR10_SESRA
MYSQSSTNAITSITSSLIALGHGHTHFYAFKLIRFCSVRLCNLAYARRMFDKFISPNIFLYTAIINAYTSVPDHLSAVLLYRDMTAILDAYSRYGVDVGRARKVFDEISDRNVVSWTAMISGYARAGQVGNAVLLFEEMPEGIRDFWNSIIAGCAQNGLFSEAIEFFRRWLLRGDGNQGTIVCVCFRWWNVQFGKCIHGYIYSGLGSDLFVVNGLIDMYGKCGSFEKSRIVFDKSSEITFVICVGEAKPDGDICWFC